VKNSRSISTGSYSKKLAKRVERIKKHAKGKKIRRIVLFFLMIIISTGGILYGVSNKVNMKEEQYRQYVEMPERSSLTSELLSYKDTYDLFVQEYLGNDPAQSLMGGYFYNNDSHMIYPDTTATCTLISVDGQEYEMADFLADEINVRRDYVVYRKPSSREIYIYDMVSRKNTALGITNAGEFVICGDEYYYIDLSNSSLVQSNVTTQEKKTLVADGVLSFAVAGNDLIILDSSHKLSRLNLTNNTTTLIGENITAFSFDGTLWFQNNTSVYRKKLDDKNLEPVDLGLQCNRLLGVTEAGLIFESEDGVYLFDLVNSGARKIGTDLFVGMSDNMVLWFSLIDKTYKLEKNS
jgi:hypothetical protein